MVDWESYWSVIGVSGLLVIGTLFFLFPEPLTSVLGIILVLVASGIWLAGWYRDDDEPEDRAVVEA
ncbi:hypothetical protein [Haloarcula onubensis]|uniref:Uncharacterized protein n=1 Tax=Haloarcula onubensis TaxID=2950539 RepID=A0ABU2FJR9_9EURY|nr:hypothetical protein [Halomicroarcula sp. S3CR25-11]MDS0281005.1 hypothetical protein [Halomicroarcula sp. S3CR25-11]